MPPPESDSVLTLATIRGISKCHTDSLPKTACILLSYSESAETLTLSKKPIREMLKKLGNISYEEKLVGSVFLLTAFAWIFRKMLNQIPMFSGLEDAVIAMIGGLSLFFVKTKDKENTLLVWKDIERGFPWGLIFLFGGGMALAYTVTDTGLAQWIANLIPSGLSLIVLLGLLICLIVFLTELTSNIATTMTFIPIIYAVSIKLGINPLIKLGKEYLTSNNFVRLKDSNKETGKTLDKKTKSKQIKKSSKSGEEKIQIKIEDNANSKDNSTNKSNEVIFTDKKDEIEPANDLKNARKKRRRSSASIE